MSRPRIGQQLLMAIALGLFILPAVSRGQTIPKPKDSTGSYPSLSIVNSVSIANDGTAAPNTTYFSSFNLTNNDLVIVPAVQDEAHALATYQAVNDMVRAAADGGAYDGMGITSSFVAQEANQNQLLGIGVLLNDDGSGNALWGDPNTSAFGPFDGDASISNFDTIVKYTWVGDLFLEGAVRTGDVTTIFSHIGKTFAGNSATSQTWNNGDMFYGNTQGVPIPTTADIIAFNALQHQNDANPFGGAVPSGLSVPEPSSLMLIGIGALGLIFTAVRKKASL